MDFWVVMGLGGMAIFGVMALLAYAYRVNREMGDSFWGAIGNILSGFFMILVIEYLIYTATQIVF